MSGAIRIGACGHPQRCLVGQYWQCIAMPECSGKPGGCKRCGSRDLYAFHSPLTPDGSMACRACGHVWWNPDSLTG